MSFKSWLLTSSIKDAFFFTNIRKLARAIHILRGHRWSEHWASATVTIGDKTVQIKFRKCIDCGIEEMMHEDGKWIPRSQSAKELWMDDVGTIALEATELIQSRLKEKGIELRTPEEDKFYVPIFDVLEKYSNGEYKNYN